MILIDTISRKIKWLRRKRDQRISFRKEFDEFSSASARNFRLSWNDAIPYLSEKTATTEFDAHYVYHPAWAARIVRRIDPAVHIDISSTLHFCTQLSAFIPVEFYDYRPALLNLDNLKSLRADLNNLHFESDSITCVSCMHTLEHVGLGRYGDKLDPDGDLKAMAELKRVVAPGGSLLIVVPVGRPAIIFNAHRIYDPADFVKLFDGFELKDFSYVADTNEFIQNASPAAAKNEQYGCGCFWFIKIKRE